MNDLEKAEIKQNKAIRGYIIRCLVKGYNNTALTRQLSNAMIAAGLIISPDISKYLDYLQGAGYIEFTEEKVTAYNAYSNDAVIKLTKAGVDLAEGTTDDNGVDICWGRRETSRESTPKLTSSLKIYTRKWM